MYCRVPLVLYIVDGLSFFITILSLETFSYICQGVKLMSSSISTSRSLQTLQTDEGYCVRQIIKQISLKIRKKIVRK